MLKFERIVHRIASILLYVTPIVLIVFALFDLVSAPVLLIVTGLYILLIGVMQVFLGEDHAK